MDHIQGEWSGMKRNIIEPGGHQFAVEGGPEHVLVVDIAGQLRVVQQRILLLAGLGQVEDIGVVPEEQFPVVGVHIDGGLVVGEELREGIDRRQLAEVVGQRDQFIVLAVDEGAGKGAQEGHQKPNELEHYHDPVSFG